MRFGLNLSSFIVPEWKQCYVDYQTLKVFIMIIKQIVQSLQKTDAAIEQADEQEKTTIQNIEFNDHITVSRQIMNFHSIKKILIAKMHTINKLFYHAHQMQMHMAQLFYQMKCLQLSNKFSIVKEIGSKQFDQKQLPIFLSLIQYAYIQTMYLSQMKQMNLQGQRKILKKHKKYSCKMVTTPASINQKFNRIGVIHEKLIDQMQDYYVQKNTIQGQSKESRQYLRKTAQKIQATNMDSFLVGLWIGSSISLLIFLVVIITYNQLNIDKKSPFSRDFPTWRGLAIFIFYIWVLGFDTYAYEQYKISHRLIFKYNDHHYSTSISIFKIAGLHTSIFLILFLLYILMLTKVSDLGGYLQPEYICLIGWGVFLLSLLIPLPILNYKGRLFGFKLLFRAIFAPFLGVQFAIIWMTDQLVSLVTPLKDFAYTICYYKDIDFSTSENPCNSADRADVVLTVAIIAYSLRTLQCLRQGYDKGQYFFTPMFFNTLKYFASLLTVILSYQYKQIGNSQILVVWLCFAGLSTIYSYFWDLKMDWGLLQPNDRNPFLRKYISFEPRRNYYAVILLNLVMRLSWVLTLSPNIAQLFGNANIFTLVTGMIEIMRRGIWNLLRVQKQHLQNCGNFKAVPDSSEMQKKLRKLQPVEQFQVLLVRLIDNMDENEQNLRSKFLQLIRQEIVKNQQFKRIYNADYQQKQLKEIKKIMKAVPKINLKQRRKTLKSLKEANKKKK